MVLFLIVWVNYYFQSFYVYLCITGRFLLHFDIFSINGFIGTSIFSTPIINSINVALYCYPFCSAIKIHRTKFGFFFTNVSKVLITSYRNKSLRLYLFHKSLLFLLSTVAMATTTSIKWSMKQSHQTSRQIFSVFTLSNFPVFVFKLYTLVTPNLESSWENPIYISPVFVILNFYVYRICECTKISVILPLTTKICDKIL